MNAKRGLGSVTRSKLPMSMTSENGLSKNNKQIQQRLLAWILLSERTDHQGGVKDSERTSEKKVEKGSTAGDGYPLLSIYVGTQDLLHR